MGLTVEQVQRLRDEFAIYTVNSARINVASFNDSNIDYFIDALATVLEIFKGNLQSSYALLKKGDDRALRFWNDYSIKFIEYEDHGQPLVDLITQIAEAF